MTLKEQRVNPKKTGKCFLIGTSISMLVSALMGMILATMVNTEKISEIGMGYGVMMTLILAAFFGGYTSCQMRKEQRLPTALLTGMLYFAVLITINLLVFGDGFYGLGETALLILCGSMLCAMWTSRKKSTGKMKKMKFSNG